MAQRVFLSYSRADGPAVARIRAALEADGHTVWVDVTDVRGGAVWRGAIVSGIEQSDIVIVVLSRDSTASENVLAEVQIASELHKPIMPVRLDDTAVGGALRYTLVGLEIVDLSRRTPDGLDSIRRALSATPTSSPAPTIAKRSRSTTLAIAAAVSLAVVAVALIVRFSLPTTGPVSAAGATPPPGSTSMPTSVETTKATADPAEYAAAQRVNAEKLADGLGSPIMAVNFTDRARESCPDEGCTWPDGFVYVDPPGFAVFPATSTCTANGYAWAHREAEFLPIRETEHDEVFWTHAWGNLLYEFEIEPGSYLVVLRFAEIARPYKPDERRFTASVGGLESGVIDIERTVGLAEAFDLAWPVTIGTDEMLEVRLIAGDADCPSISALVVFAR